MARGLSILPSKVSGLSDQLSAHLIGISIGINVVAVGQHVNEKTAPADTTSEYSKYDLFMHVKAEALLHVAGIAMQILPLASVH